MSETINKRAVVHLDNTKFIFRTNFAGDKEKDKYGNESRRGNILIPDQETADYISSLGINVKETSPREGEEEGFVPRYYMPVIINYKSEMAKKRPPKIYLVTGENGTPVELDEDTVGQIDYTYVTNVKATIEIIYLQRFDKMAAYVRTMYVFQDEDDDPWASEFNRG